MREMKDSGVEWIGEIPINWKRSRLGYVCDEFIVPMRDKPQKFDGDIPWCRIEDIEGKYINGTKSNQYVSQDTIDELNLKVYPIGTIINSCSATIGVSAIVTRPLCTNQTFIGLVAGDEINNIYLFWLMNALGDYQKFAGHGSTITYISQDKYRKMDIPLPDKSEQKRIADYLDKKCAKIDAIIEKQQTIIEKLKEYKLSVITEAVTKGINPDVEMKDSGIYICNYIPKHWNISQNRYLFSLREERNYKPLEDVQLLSLYTDLGVFPHGEQEERGNKAVTAEGYKVVYEDDIIVNIILAWMGAIGRSAYNGVTSPAYDIYKPNDGVCSRFYHYLFRTKLYAGECYKYGRGIMAMRWRTYSSEFKSIKVPVPPYNEQCQIADYLDKKCALIDKTIADRNGAIEKLQEYKKSLIYEVVTGKKEV